MTALLDHGDYYRAGWTAGWDRAVRYPRDDYTQGLARCPEPDLTPGGRELYEHGYRVGWTDRRRHMSGRHKA